MILLDRLPFTLHWIVKKNIGKNVKTIIDLGCGDGSFTKDISYGEKWKITGVELYDDSIKRAEGLKLYEQIVKSDVTAIPRGINKNKYDVVVSIQVIEHLSKKVGEAALQKWENLAKKKVIIATPVGFMKFDRVERKKDKNKLQKHLSGWDPEEFRERGYRVYGQGLKLVYGENGLVRKMHPIFWPFLIVLSYLIAPAVFLFPKLGTYMIAVKNIKK